MNIVIECGVVGTMGAARRDVAQVFVFGAVNLL